MAVVTGMKLYAIINKADSLLGGFIDFPFTYEPPDPEPTPSFSDPDIIFEYVSDATLGGLTIQEFIAKKKPVIVGGAFDSWADRSVAPTFDISENPKDDGSNSPTITLSGAPANAKFRISFSRAVSTDLSGLKGTFDGSGEATFKIKVIGQGDLTLNVEARANSEFEDGSYAITVDAAPL